MRTKILAIIIWAMALPSFAALQMVDISTLTTNKITNTVLPGILFTNFTTNLFNGYTTVNTNALQIGDTPYQAFAKVNANFTLLSPLTNAITSLMPTNATVPSVSGNIGFIPTNSGTGVAGITNLVATNALTPSVSGSTGFIPTNSASGIPLTNGTGTATTLLASPSVTTTNLSVIGTTWLNNSNIVISYGYTGTNRMIIVTGAGSYYDGTEYFDGNGIYYPNTNMPVLGGFGYTNATLHLNTGNGRSFIFDMYDTSTVSKLVACYYTNALISSYYAGTNNLPTINGQSISVPAYFPATNPVATLTFYSSSTPVNVISNSTTLEIISTNGGVAINSDSIPQNTDGTTSTLYVAPGGNGNGSVNDTGGYYINGVPIGASPSSGNFQKLYVTNAVSWATNYNGIYDNTGSGYYTNETTGWCLIVKGSIIAGNTWIVNLLTTNALTVNDHPQYVNASSLIGNYTPQSTSPNNNVAVSLYQDGPLLTGLNYRAGFTNIPTLTTSQAVLFSTPFSPTVGTNYHVGISFDTALAAAVGFSTTSKTTNGFTITLSGTITGAVTVDYAAWPYQ